MKEQLVGSIPLEKLGQYRRKCGMSASALAREADVARGTIVKAEKEQKIKRTTATKILVTLARVASSKKISLDLSSEADRLGYESDFFDMVTDGSVVNKSTGDDSQSFSNEFEDVAELLIHATDCLERFRMSRVEKISGVPHDLYESLHSAYMNVRSRRNDAERFVADTRIVP